MSAPAPSPAPLAWALSPGFVSDAGRARGRNEDSFALYLPYEGAPPTGAVDALFLVADGMGGHEAGDLASRFAAERVASALGEPAADDVGGEDLPTRLERLLQDVNHELVALAAARGAARGLGTTLTLAVLRGATIHIAHVGDSRCYRLRDGVLAQLTPDHSWVAEQVRAGLLSPEEARHHPRRNILTQCLGLDRSLEVFAAAEPVCAGDRYLLCTDGLHGTVADEAIAGALLAEPGAQAAAERLVRLANEAGGPDNITAIVVDFSPPAAARAALRTTLPGITLPPPPAAPPARRRTGARLLVAAGSLLLIGALAAGIYLGLARRHSATPAARPAATLPAVEAGSSEARPPAPASRPPQE